MTTATPTVLPRSRVFPTLLPNPPAMHPRPLPPSDSTPKRMSARRDIWREMEALSEEEADLEQLNLQIKDRGYAWYVPLGKTLTQQEEKNDADEEDETDTEDEGDDDDEEGDDDEDEEEGEEETEEEEGEDLDADMEDMDGEDEGMDDDAA